VVKSAEFLADRTVVRREEVQAVRVGRTSRDMIVLLERELAVLT
jgi:hypothetical protein